MGFQMRGVDHDRLRLAALPCQFSENLVEHAQPAAAHEPVLGRLVQAVPGADPSRGRSRDRSKVERILFFAQREGHAKGNPSGNRSQALTVFAAVCPNKIFLPSSVTAGRVA
jgi:hypothetical protein